MVSQCQLSIPCTETGFVTCKLSFPGKSSTHSKLTEVPYAGTWAGYVCFHNWVLGWCRDRKIETHRQTHRHGEMMSPLPKQKWSVEPGTVFSWVNLDWLHFVSLSALCPEVEKSRLSMLHKEMDQGSRTSQCWKPQESVVLISRQATVGQLKIPDRYKARCVEGYQWGELGSRCADAWGVDLKKYLGGKARGLKRRLASAQQSLQTLKLLPG